MAWASEKAALETAGAWRHLVLEIDLTDPDGILPNTGQWTASRTLYLSDEYLRRTSSGAVALTKYQKAVTDWGSISAAASMSTAFEATGDVQITLSNAAITHQEPGSDISGVTGLSPEPIGEELRLIELVRLYNWEGSAVRVKVLTLGSYTTDQANADVEYQLTTIFTGEIAEVDATHDALVLDITQSDAVERSKLPGRNITDSPQENFNNRRAPLVYGDWVPGTSLVADKEHMVGIGFKPGLTPALPYQRNSSDENITEYIWNDLAGLGITSQPDFGTAAGDPTVTSGLYLYYGDSDCMAEVQTSSSTGAGLTNWVDGATANAELLLHVNEYVNAKLYCPGVAVVASTGVTNPENAIDRDPNTYAALDVSSTSNYIHLRMPELSRYGFIPQANNAVAGYVVLDTSSVDVGTSLDFGLWRIAGTPAFVGSATDTISAGEMAAGGVLVQSTIPSTAYVRAASGYQEPLLLWQFAYSDGSWTVDDVYLRIKVGTAGSGGQECRIIAAGAVITYRSTVSDQPWIRQGILDRSRNGHRLERKVYRDVINQIRAIEPEPRYADIYVMPGKCTIDDASGTITGTGEANIEHPIDIARHLLTGWGVDISGSDLETTTSTFGTFASTAKTRLNRWIGQNVAGGSSNTWKCAWTIANDTTVASALAQLCSEAPMMIQRDPATGKFLCAVYENDLLGASGQDWEKFLDADGNKVTFHPNYFDERGQTSGRGRPYSVRDFGARSGGREGRYTDVRVRFRRFAPTGAFLDSVYANPDGQKVWSVTAGDYVEGASGTLYTQCGAAEGYLGRRTEEFVLESVTIQDPATATGLLWYLTTVLTGQPVRVRGFTDAEGCVLKPGHAFQVSNDMNLWNPMPYYGQQNWENYYFYCTRVETSFNDREPVVYFEGVQWLTI